MKEQKNISNVKYSNNLIPGEGNGEVVRGGTIIFFMLVTNRDTYLASYSIKSYSKLIPTLTNYNWKLVVYLNCLKDEFKRTYVEEWRQLDYVEIIDNDDFVNRGELIPGNIVKSENGYNVVEGIYEPCCVVWTREFRTFKSDYWATVDADFEILSPDFIAAAFNMFKKNNNLIAVSSDCSCTNFRFDTYNNENIMLMKRYHTWFCIYKKEAQKCETSHFYYKEIIYGVKFTFDDAAKFQWDLRERFNYEMEAVDKKYQRSYIHYGAFSKNTSLDTPQKINLYRKVSILSRRGLFGNSSICDKIIRKTFKIIHKILYKKNTIERGRLNYHSKLDS